LGIKLAIVATIENTQRASKRPVAGRGVSAKAHYDELKYLAKTRVAIALPSSRDVDIGTE
jgi:hypothetical protein